MVRKGTKMSKESRDKMSKSRLGKVPWNKGLKNPYPEIVNEKIGESVRKLWKDDDYREMQTESRNNSEAYKNKGIKQSATMKKLWEENPKYREENITNQKNRWKNDESFRKRQLKILRKSRKNPSSIEKMFAKELENQNISYIPQMIILNRYIVDFLVEDNICIECDGDFWHNLPNIQKKDKIRDETLKSNGYVIFRFWQHEIIDDVSNCVNKIKECIS